MKKPISFHLRHLTEILFLVWSITFFLPGGACNAQGSIDHSFNPGDIGFGNGAGCSGVSTTIIQPDGKILIGGGFTSVNGVSRVRIARLNTDGTVDTTFNPGTGANGQINSVALQPDGKIIIGGNFNSINGVTKNYLARLNADGSLESSFNTGSGANNQIWTIALQPDGKIIIGGSFTTYNGVGKYYIARLNSNGTPDNSFYTGTGPNSVILTSSLQPDGKVFIGGYFTSINGTSRNHVARINANGSLDSTFNPGTGIDDPNSYVLTSAIQSNGKIIFGGSFIEYNGTARYKIARVNTNGTLDLGFNTGTGFVGRVYAVSVQSDGKIIVGGSFASYNGTNRNNIVRLNTNGSSDVPFNQGTGTAPSNIVNSTAIQPDGKIVIAGGFNSYNSSGANSFARINIDGTVDTVFNSNTGANNWICTSALQPDGKIIIGGEFTSYNGSGRIRIARLNSDGTLDYSFDPGIGVNKRVSTIALQPDGKIIIGGLFTSYNGTARNHIARLNDDGTLDSTFNPGTGPDFWVLASAIQTDGKIVIGGLFQDYGGINRKYIARLNIDGTLDTTFYPGNAFTFPINSINLQSDGKIIGAGTHIKRLNTNGTIDTTFNQGSVSVGEIYTSAIQPDGKIIIAGNFNSFNGASSPGINRLNSNGTSDITFSQFIGPNDTIMTVTLQPDGKIIIGGEFSTYGNIAFNGITRINSNGTVDTTFNSSGLEANDAIYTTLLQPDGKIIIGGYFTAYNGTGRNKIARILNCTSSLSYDVQTACNSFTWIDGNTYTSSNNTAVYNIPGGAANGCDSVVMLNLTINAPTVTISALGNVSFCQGDSVTLSAQSNAITHQWYRTGVAVVNATGISYEAKTSGKYRCVGVDSTGCTDTSNTIVVTVPCILPEPPIERITPDNHVFQPVIISPNPVNNNVSFKFTSTVPNGFVVELSDVYGKTVWRQHFQNTGKEYSFSLPDRLTNGMYICRIISPEIEQTSKIIVKR